MINRLVLLSILLTALGIATGSAIAADELPAPEQQKAATEDASVSFWPLFDYRESPREGFRNLSILGPLVKWQQRGENREMAVRPFWYHKEAPGRKSDVVLYPLLKCAATENEQSCSGAQLFSSKTTHGPSGDDSSIGLFPFYLTGTSATKGDYRAIFPLYGDIYDRFWRDEYHFVLFPLYGSTVKAGTTTNHYLWPFFSTTSGAEESGFEVFPLYGQSAKKGVYSRNYLLWPFITWSDKTVEGRGTTSERALMPLYAATDSPGVTARSYLWPFFGYRDDRDNKSRETDYLWPFIASVQGEKRNSLSILPFYAHDAYPGGEKSWYLWPLYRHEESSSSDYRSSSDRGLYFVYRNSSETWPKSGDTRDKTGVWPLFWYRHDSAGVSSLSLPAPVEPILDRDEIETSWAPLWRLYQQRWDDHGNSASSLFWNFFWHEKKGDDLAYELFPLLAYTSNSERKQVKLLKGLIKIDLDKKERELGLFWLPYTLKWATTQ